MNFALPLLAQFVVHLPLYAIWIVGIFLAVTRRDEHPAGYPLVTIALSILFAVSVLGTIANTMIPLLVVQNGRTVTEVGLLLGISNIIQMLVNAVAWVLILMALFRRRTPSAPSAPRPERSTTF